MSTLIKRYFFFILGLIINSFGVAFITKSALGTSQISSIPYVLSLKFTNLSFGQTTFIFNMLFILIQLLILKKDFRPIQFLQIAANILFSSFIDVSMTLLTGLNPQTIPLRTLSLLVGCAILAVGISVEVAPGCHQSSGRRHRPRHGQSIRHGIRQSQDPVRCDPDRHGHAPVFPFLPQIKRNRTGNHHLCRTGRTYDLFREPVSSGNREDTRTGRPPLVWEDVPEVNPGDCEKNITQKKEGPRVYKSPWSFFCVKTS